MVYIRKVKNNFCKFDLAYLVVLSSIVISGFVYCSWISLIGILACLFIKED